MIANYDRLFSWRIFHLIIKKINNLLFHWLYFDNILQFWNWNKLYLLVNINLFCGLKFTGKLLLPFAFYKYFYIALWHIGRIVEFLELIVASFFRMSQCISIQCIYRQWQKFGVISVNTILVILAKTRCDRSFFHFAFFEILLLYRNGFKKLLKGRFFQMLPPIFFVEFLTSTFNSEYFPYSVPCIKN